ncbi:hypothetical protein [Paraburkholderia sp. BL17N1]|nr:hypothetical protein [Paraburkholderia sp. BL17N1]
MGCDDLQSGEALAGLRVVDDPCGLRPEGTGRKPAERLSKYEQTPTDSSRFAIAEELQLGAKRTFSPVAAYLDIRAWLKHLSPKRLNVA